MKYGDLSSIVQLGVGLHVGTAVLQLYTELGAAPLERRLARIRCLFEMPEGECPPPNLREELRRLEARYEVFKIRLFRKYRWLIVANSAVAGVLAIFLIVIACNAANDIIEETEWFAIVAISFSFLPAPLMLGVLSWDGWKDVAPLKKLADDIETRAITEI